MQFIFDKKKFFLQVQLEGAKCSSEYVLIFRDLRPQLLNLCSRIDNLEKFIERISIDLATLESDIDVAESDFGVPERRFGMLNPLSFFVRQFPRKLLLKKIYIFRNKIIALIFFRKKLQKQHLLLGPLLCIDHQY